MSMPKQGRKATWQYSDGAYDLPDETRCVTCKAPFTENQVRVWPHTMQGITGPYCLTCDPSRTPAPQTE